MEQYIKSIQKQNSFLPLVLKISISLLCIMTGVLLYGYTTSNFIDDKVQASKTLATKTQIENPIESEEKTATLTATLWEAEDSKWILSELNVLDLTKTLSSDKIKNLREFFLKDFPLKETVLTLKSNKEAILERSNNRKQVGSYILVNNRLTLSLTRPGCYQCREQIINFEVIEQLEDKLTLSLASEIEENQTKTLFVFKKS